MWIFFYLGPVLHILYHMFLENSEALGARRARYRWYMIDCT